MSLSSDRVINRLGNVQLHVAPLLQEEVIGTTQR